MSRNSSGTMSATAGQPAVAGTVISTSVFNALVADLIAELTDSLSRSGKGSMTAPLKTPDGSVSAPAHSFTSEGSGWYRAGAGDIRLSISGVDALQMIAGLLALTGATPAIRASGSNASLNLQGNRTATDVNADVAMTSLATRTAGLLLDVQNNGAGKFQVDYQGLARLASQAAALQPASLWTAITPTANWTAGSGLAYWKDTTGVVRLKGTLTFATGAVNPAFTLPANFRPGASRFPSGINSSTGGAIMVQIDFNGNVSIFPLPLTNGNVYALDGVSILAEA